MTEDDIEELAYEAGHFFLIQFGTASASMDWLRKFADKVAAAEREACAQTAHTALLGADFELTKRVLKAIRARGEK